MALALALSVMLYAGAAALFGWFRLAFGLVVLACVIMAIAELFTKR